MKNTIFVYPKLSSMKVLSKQLIITAIAMMALDASASQEHKLWYDKPAQVWTEALPLGNGRLGAMVYGNPGAEQIQLNEETIWAGQPNNNASGFQRFASSCLKVSIVRLRTWLQLM